MQNQKNNRLLHLPKQIIDYIYEYLPRPNLRDIQEDIHLMQNKTCRFCRKKITIRNLHEYKISHPFCSKICMSRDENEIWSY